MFVKHRERSRAFWNVGSLGSSIFNVAVSRGGAVQISGERQDPPPKSSGSGHLFGSCFGGVEMWQENVKLKHQEAAWSLMVSLMLYLSETKIKLVYWCSDGYNGYETVILCNVVHVCRVGPTAYRVPITSSYFLSHSRRRQRLHGRKHTCSFWMLRLRLHSLSYFTRGDESSAGYIFIYPQVSCVAQAQNSVNYKDFLFTLYISYKVSHPR